MFNGQRQCSGIITVGLDNLPKTLKGTGHNSKTAFNIKTACHIKPRSCAQFAPGVANLHPGCIFGHVNGVLRICTRVLKDPPLRANLRPRFRCNP